MMPRIRTIKPEFWRSESIACLPVRARLTFIGLWTYVDDNGVGLDNFKLVAAELFGLEEDPREARDNVREDLARLHAAGRIVRYMVDGKRYLAIVNWGEHQKIDRPGKARYPDPSAEPVALLSSEDAERMDGSATRFEAPSRESREGVAAGTGNREQGAGNRGTGSTTPPPPAAARTPEAGSDEDPGWCKFWDAYPLKVSKKDARARYIAALKKAKPEDITAGAEAYRDRVERERIPRDKIKHPDGWLNGERWKDEAQIALLPPATTDRDHQGRGGSALARRDTPPGPRSPADQRVADAAPLYEKYKRLEQETARG